jgi:hypothetical protein
MYSDFSFKSPVSLKIMPLYLFFSKMLTTITGVYPLCGANIYSGQHGLQQHFGYLIHDHPTLGPPKLLALTSAIFN